MAILQDFKLQIEMLQATKNILRQKAIHDIPEKIIDALPKEDRKNKFCYVFLGDVKDGYMFSSETNNEYHFAALILALLADDKARAIITHLVEKSK